MRIRGHLGALFLMLAIMLATVLVGCAKTLDRDGGVRVTLEVSCLPAEPQCDLGGKMGPTIAVLKQRGLDGLKVPDAAVRQEGGSRIVVELPGYADTSSASSVLGTRGELVMVDTGGTGLSEGTSILANGNYQYPVVFNGTQLDPGLISYGLDQQTRKPVVTFGFAGDAKNTFGEYTRTHIGEYLTVALDGKVIESATIQSEIDGQGQITGLESLEQAQTLAALLKSRPLPQLRKVVSAERVKPATQWNWPGEI
jgi:preprotein translocase subunit SecD